jgi:AraC-like DNA-binding protein
MRDEPSSPTLWLDEILAETPPDADGHLRHGGSGARTELVCGGFVLEGDTSNPILSSLPRVIHIDSSDAGPRPWVAATLELLGTVTAADVPGADVVVARLADTMLAQALRTELVALASKHAGALQDPQIATAIHLIHAQPYEAWTVERLAEEVSYSRSAFAARFRELVGEAPMSYVTRTRLAVGATLLQRTNISIGEVAKRTGYSSEASFSRAFKRTFGLAPGAYRASPRDSAHSP